MRPTFLFLLTLLVLGVPGCFNHTEEEFGIENRSSEDLTVRSSTVLFLDSVLQAPIDQWVRLHQRRRRAYHRDPMGPDEFRDQIRSLELWSGDALLYRTDAPDMMRWEIRQDHFIGTMFRSYVFVVHDTLLIQP